MIQARWRHKRVCWHGRRFSAHSLEVCGASLETWHPRGGGIVLATVLRSGRRWHYDAGTWQRPWGYRSHWQLARRAVESRLAGVEVVR